MTNETQAQTTANVPAWYTDYVAAYVAAQAHTFTLYGGVNDYAVAGITNVTYLVRQMIAQGRIVAHYDRAQGVQFETPEMRERAIALYNGKKPAAASAPRPAAPGGAVSAALAAMQAQRGAAPGAPGAEQEDPFAAQRPGAALAALDRLLRAWDGTDEKTGQPKRAKVAVIVHHADKLMPNADTAALSPDDRTLLVTLLNWAIDAELGRIANPIFLLTQRLEDLHRDLRDSASGARAIEIRLPDRAARVAYIAAIMQARAEDKKPVALLDGLTVDELANVTAGLALRHIEDVILQGARAGGITRLLVKARKDEIIATENSSVAEMIEPLPQGFAALGGMQHLIDWANTDIIGPIRAGRIEDAPKGALLVGPPGGGKTFFVRALAREAGFNAVMLRSENILGGIVGESEAKLKQFFGFVKALAPVIVFIDEIDQTDMAQRGNSSGNPVAKNLFNQLLQFMSDETLRGKVIVLFASNRPDLLDSALMRSGRMDAIIPVLLPDEGARTSITEAQARIQGTRLERGVAAAVAARTDNYSSADLAAIVTKARKLAGRAGRDTITLADAEKAMSLLRPNSPETAQYYTFLAVKACNDAEYLPPELGGWLDDRPALEKAIAEAKPADVDAPAFRSERTI